MLRAFAEVGYCGCEGRYPFAEEPVPVYVSRLS